MFASTRDTKRHRFASYRGKDLLPRETQLCLSEMKNKKRVFGYGFFYQVSPRFSMKRKLKPINMGYNFKDLDARNPTVKMVPDLDARFKR